MKCVEKGSEIYRVDNDQAETMVAKQGYQFCSKTDWKISTGRKTLKTAKTSTESTGTSTPETDAPKGKGGGKSKKTLRAKKAKVQKTAAELLK